MTAPMTSAEVQAALARGETVSFHTMKAALTRKVSGQAGDVDRGVKAEHAATHRRNLWKSAIQRPREK